MKDEDKTKEQFLNELAEMRQRIAELRKSENQLRRMEEALRASELKYQTLFDAAKDAIFLADETGRFVDVNQAACRSLGYSKEELLKLSNKEIDADPRGYEAFLKVRDGVVQEVKFEVNQRRKDGALLPVEITGTFFESGGRRTALAIARDITKRKRAQEALQESEEKYRTLIESSIDGIGLAMDGKIVFGSSGLLKMLGYDWLEEVIGKPIESAVVPEMREKIKEMHLKHLRGEITTDRYEFKGLRKDGTIIDIEGSFNTISYKGKPAVLAILRDITEHKRMMAKLSESEEKYRNLFENANDTIFIADTKTGIILDANKQAEQLIGRSKEEIIGMHQSKLHPPDRAEYYKDKFRKHVRKGRILDLGAEVIKKDGSIIPIVINAGVISLRGKKVIQAIFRDITEEKRISDLKEEIVARKLIEKAKGILMDRHKISEKEAMRRLQKESRRQSRKMKEIAKDVISSESILN